MEEERILYLDCDMIFTQDLSPLFEVDLKGYGLGAVVDKPTTTDGFNAGLLVIDKTWWQEHQVTEASFDLTRKYHQQVYGDQGNFESVFQNAWFPLPWTYNLQVGSDKDQYLYGDLDWYEAFQGIPAVIHYTSHNKPWTSKRFQSFRELWWFYYALFRGNFASKTDFEANLSRSSGTFPYHAAIYTHTADIHELETLLKELPGCRDSCSCP